MRFVRTWQRPSWRERRSDQRIGSQSGSSWSFLQPSWRFLWEGLGYPLARALLLNRWINNVERNYENDIREFDTWRCAWVVWDASRVDSLRFINSTNNSAINSELETVGLPIDLSFKKKSSWFKPQWKGRIFSNVRCNHGNYWKYLSNYHGWRPRWGSLYISLQQCRQKDSEKWHTNDSLPEIITLALSGVCTREFPVYFILNVTHGDESCDDTSPATSLDYQNDSVNTSWRLKCFNVRLVVIFP